MFKRILVPLGIDAEPTAAIRTAALLLRSANGEVVFCRHPRAHPAPRPTQTSAVPIHPEHETPEPARAGQALHASARQQAEHLGVMSRTVTYLSEDAVEGLLEALRSTRCELIALESEGSNALLRLITGHVIPALITAAPVPVLVCPPSPGYNSAAQPGRLRRVLVVLDEAEAVAVATKLGVDLARAHGADLLFVHLARPDQPALADAMGFATGPDEVMAARVAEHSLHLLAAARATGHAAGLRTSSKSFAVGTAASDLAQFALDQSCDLIVVAHEGRNAVMRLLTGSLVPGLVTASTVPLLVCRTPDGQAQPLLPQRRRSGPGTKGGG